MNILEILPTIVSCMSITIGFMAICLSLWFYKQSSEFSMKFREDSEKMKSSIKRLDQLMEIMIKANVDLLHDTVKEALIPNNLNAENIRKEIEHKTEPLLNEIVQDLSKDIKNNEDKQNIRKDLENIRKIDKVAREEIIEEKILEILKIEVFKKKRVRQILDQILTISGKEFAELEILRVLEKMNNENLIAFDSKTIHEGTNVYLK